MQRKAHIESDQTLRTATVIPPNVLIHVLGHADRRGIGVQRWFAGLGLSSRRLLDPGARVSYHQARTILARALHDFDEPGLGLSIGNGQSLGSFGLLGLVMVTCPTFGEAMRLGIENHQVSGSLMDMDFKRLPNNEVALDLWPRFDDPQLQPFLCEEAIASSARLASELIGPDFRLNRVELTYAAPEYAGLYESVLRTRVQFGARHNRAVLDASCLQHPLPGYSPLTARQALKLCLEQRALNHDATTHEVVSSVRSVLRDRLGEPPRIGEVAATLHLSERSLRRKLADAGHSFRQVRNDVRGEHALQLLRGSSLPMMDVAEAVGFSDAREFRRAFKRWSGVCPRDVRRQQPES